MRNLTLAVCLVVLGSVTARADFLYTFEQTGTSSSFSFTTPTILTGTHDPFTEVIGLSVGGFTITDAIFGPVNASQYCFGFGASGTDAFLLSGSCGLTNPTGLVGIVSAIPNPTAVGVYAFSGAAFGGFPNLNRLTISEVATTPVPEPGTIGLLGAAILALVPHVRKRYRASKSV
jgi:hypothetical protein